MHAWCQPLAMSSAVVYGALRLASRVSSQTIPINKAPTAAGEGSEIGALTDAISSQ